MSPVTLVGLLIFVIALAVVASDYSSMQATRRREEERTRELERTGGTPLPIDTVRGGNDPAIIMLQQQVRDLSSLVGAAVGQGVGGGAGRAVGTAVSAASAESARGLATNPVSVSETRKLVEQAQSSSAAFGQAWGAGVFGAIGGALGNIPALPFYVAQGAANAIGGSFEGLYRNLEARDAFSLPEKLGIRR